MQPSTSPRKKPKSPGIDASFNPKTSITCANVPEGLFDGPTAKKHFSKFGRVQRIRMFPKRQACIIDYEQPLSAERALLNAGAFDGFMFDVTRSKPRVRKRSKREDDPDWVPSSDVEAELSAMSGAPTYRVPRQKAMDVEAEAPKPKLISRVVKQSPVRKQKPVREHPPVMPQPKSGFESPVLVTTTQTTLSVMEAAAELHQLRFKISLTPDEQWRILEARDKVLRGWGGAGSRVKVGGATIGTCQDMCPEKELLHRQAEHQVMTLETVPESDGQLEAWRAVKQYSRSSADQEMPMCYELRPARVLARTCAYLLHEIADTDRQVTLADWFHFMWDRFRSIRKDITQQALCCSESICLVEMCARFHAHCAARLADLEHTQFDQKLNTDNLTKCLQTLKHMYTDVTPDKKPREAEFRGYIALLNLGDANFWWEIQQLPQDIQKSPPILFAIQVFNALDNNNYVRFFRLIKERATYLQACILLRYFNDVRARALARMVKAYAPRGGSRFPASDMINALAFESIESMKTFINHYGLRFARADDYELSIILDRNQFIEDSDPLPVARAVQLIESKRQSTVGEVIAGGQLPRADYSQHILYTSFTQDGKLKESALVAEDQGYNTTNDSQKDVKSLKAELQRLAQGGKNYGNVKTFSEPKSILFEKPDAKSVSPRSKGNFTNDIMSDPKSFSFTPAIPVASSEVIKNSPDKLFEKNQKIFSFSKPQETLPPGNLFTGKAADNVFAPSKSLFQNKTTPDPRGLFTRTSNENKDPFKSAQNLFKSTKPDASLKKSEPSNTIFAQTVEVNQSNNVFGTKTSLTTNNKNESKTLFSDKNIFANAKGNSLFTKPDSTVKFDKSANIFAKQAQGTDKGINLFAKPPHETEKSVNLFTKSIQDSQKAVNIFAKPVQDTPKSANIFAKTVQDTTKGTNIFAQPVQETEKPANIFAKHVQDTVKGDNLFAKPIQDTDKGSNVFSNEKSANLFAKPIKSMENTTNIFAKHVQETIKVPNNVFGKAVQNTEKTPNLFANENGNNLFAKPIQETEGTNLFAAKPAPSSEDIKKPNIFGAFNKGIEATNLFAKPDLVGDQNTNSLFPPNGDASQSPGSLFKSVLNPPSGPDGKSYSIFQSKNTPQTVADNILQSVQATTNNSVYDFNQNDDEIQQQLMLQRLKEERIKEEERQRQEQLRIEQERKQQELQRKEEERRKEEARRKQEEQRLLEEKRKKEEEKRQENLRKKLEEERKAELKRKAEEEEKRFKEMVDRESNKLTEELVTEINNETNREILKEEQEKLNALVQFANNTNNEIITELIGEICHIEMQAEMVLTNRIMRKWFHVWRQQFIRNVKRRKLLEDTPVWLPERSPIEQAINLRRFVEDSALKKMNDVHKGHKFTGELKQPPSPEPYNLMELIRSPLLKRMKQINYPYDKCFFWKVTLVAPGEDKWLFRKINIQKWLIDAFSDKKTHEESPTLIQVGKHSWNHLMDFAISVSLVNKEKMGNCGEAIEGTNGVLFYTTESNHNLVETIKQTLKHKYPYQVIPVAVIMPKTNQESTYNAIQGVLHSFVESKLISGYKIFVLDQQNIQELLHTATKTAMRWLAKKFPQTPPLEIDYLKSICQRYLGNEIWHRFRSIRDTRMGDILKDIYKLIPCYNTAVDKLADVLTNEDLFNHPSFPLEFTQYLDHTSPYPKPYEFVTSNVKTSENASAIKDLLNQLKLPISTVSFRPRSVQEMQKEIRTYCNQLGWFEDPETVVCKVVSIIPLEMSKINLTNKKFTKYFANYDLVDFLNILVYEKINALYKFDNRFAIYEKSVLDEYRNIHWFYEVDALSRTKHKTVECEDELDYYLEAKRRKLAMDSLEYLMLEDKDVTIVEENVKETDATITKYSNCSEAVKRLEKEIEEGKKKSIEFENMLKAALADV